MPLYHPDVRAWEVLDAQGRHIALFFGDYFARLPSTAAPG